MATRSATVSGTLVAYEDDFFAWTQETARHLRAGRLSAVNVEHVAEEIEDMGTRDRRELDSRMQVLLLHLLKWSVQPEPRSGSWNGTIATQRTEIAALLRDSPSLQPRLETQLASNYGIAIERAVIETGLPTERFPTTCPWSAGQIVARSFLP